jgi:hypothetical protein
MAFDLAHELEMVARELRRQGGVWIRAAGDGRLDGKAK